MFDQLPSDFRIDAAGPVAPKVFAAGPMSDVCLLAGTPRERLEWVLDQRPSSTTLRALEILANERLDAAEQVLFATALDRQKTALEGMATAALADAVGEAPEGDEPDLAVTECALAMSVSERSLLLDAWAARRFRDALPAALDRWCAGEMTGRQARALLDLTAHLSDEQARTIDQEMAARRRRRVSPGWWRNLVRRAVARIEAPEAKTRHAHARKATGAFLEPEPEGMCVLGLRCTAVDGVAALDALNRRADAARFPGDVRSHGERQADVLLDLLLNAPLAGDGVVRKRRRTEVQIGITLPALLGLRDDPAQLAGYGPIPAGLAREAISQEGTTLRRLVVEPITGRLLDYGRTKYRPDKALASLIAAIERTCRFPGCPSPAERCDIDHNHAWDAGGETSTCNCHLLCRRHHRLKTLYGYRYVIDVETGEVTWFTPLGFTYHGPPGSYPEFLDGDPPPDDE